MEIITRQDAIKAQSNRYFTGEPCKYGHVCERYTKTANCINCLHPKFESIPSAHQVEASNLKLAHRAAASNLKRLRAGMHAQNFENFRSTVWLMTSSLDSMLRERDVYPGLKPICRAGTFYIYTFCVFPEHYDFLAAMAKTLPSPVLQTYTVDGDTFEVNE